MDKEGSGILKDGQFSWTSFAYRPLKAFFIRFKRLSLKQKTIKGERPTLKIL